MRAALDREAEDVIGSARGLLRPSPHGRQAKARPLWRTLPRALTDKASRDRDTPIPRRTGDNFR